MAQISIAQTSKMCHRLGTSLGAGVDITQVLDRETQFGSSSYRRRMQEVSEDVGKGMTVAEAMKERSGYYPQLVCELVSVGEETGRLERVLLRLSDHYQHLMKIRRTFLLGILWPGLQLVGAILVIGAMIVLPPLLFGEDVNLAPFGLTGISGGLKYFGFILVVTLALALFGYGLKRGWFGSLPGRLILYVPGVGKALKTMALARMSWTLSMALDSGVDAGRSMRLAMQSTQLSYFTGHIEPVEAVIERGGQFHEALAQTNAFPHEFITGLQNAELSGTESESLEHMSNEYQRQAESASTALAFIASIAIWVLIGFVLISMIVYLFMKLYIGPMQEAIDMTNSF